MATWIVSLDSGRFAGGVDNVPVGGSKRRGVIARDGFAVWNPVGAVDAICQPPVGVTLPERGIDAGGVCIGMAAEKGGTKVAEGSFSAQGIRGRKPRLRYHATMVCTRFQFCFAMNP